MVGSSCSGVGSLGGQGREQGGSGSGGLKGGAVD